MDSLEPIKRKIYEIRGRRVMLDSDLAELYMVETKNLKRAVRANIDRFPDDFMFELTKDEFDSLRCNFFTSNTRGGNRYLPFAFTREGIAMLSGLALLIVSNTQLQLEQIRSEIRQLRTDMNDTLADQNEINELTRAQLDAISDALAELQNQDKSPLSLPEIGYTAIQKQRAKKS